MNYEEKKKEFFDFIEKEIDLDFIMFLQEDYVNDCRLHGSSLENEIAIKLEGLLYRLESFIL